jgi:predicted Ser/Thr protein kinase
MNITLRKANALQQNILDTIRGISFETHISINEFEDADTKIKTANQKLFDNLTRQNGLYEALYTIRALIGQANALNGIDNTLTVTALTEKLIQANNAVVNSPKRIADEVIKGKLDKIRQGSEREGLSSYSSRISEVTTGILDDSSIADIKSAIVKLKKQKQKYQDQILELNIKTEITLPTEVVTVLQKEDLL